MFKDASSGLDEIFWFLDGCSSKIASAIMVVALLSFVAFHIESTYPLFYQLLMFLVVLYAFGVSASLLFYSGIFRTQPVARRICKGSICFVFLCIVWVAVVFGVFTAGTVYDFAHP